MSASLRQVILSLTAALDARYESLMAAEKMKAAGCKIENRSFSNGQGEEQSETVSTIGFFQLYTRIVNFRTYETSMDPATFPAYVMS